MEIIGIVIVIELLVVVWQLNRLKNMTGRVVWSLRKIYELIWVRTYGGHMNAENHEILQEELKDF